MLFLFGTRVENADDVVGLRAAALMLLDGLQQVAGAPVVQEEEPLAEAPERRGPELAAVGAALERISKGDLPDVSSDEVALAADIVNLADADIKPDDNVRRLFEEVTRPH